MSTTISVLANETLCEIFQNLSDSLTVNEWYTRTLPSIRLVSRHWNETIETFPMLWTSILVTEKSAYPGGQPPFQSTRLRLLRSLELPLNIHIDLHISPNENSFNESDGIILGEMIKAIALRVASIELRANSHSRKIQMLILSSLNNTPMPLLRSFTQIDPHPHPKLDDGGYFQNPSSILQYPGVPESRRIITEWGRDLYPSLTDINLTGVSYNLEHLPIMHGIRRLRIGAQPLRKRPSITQILEILSPARDTLEVLQLEDVVQRSPTDALSQPIIFKKLQLLSFGYYDPHIADTFLKSVRMPALVDLVLRFTFRSRYPDQHVRIPFNLIQYYPLDQIESLALINVMFPLEGKYDIELEGPREMLEAQRSGFAPGRRKTPLFMYFLSMFRSLKHLYLDDVLGLKKMMSAHWERGTLETLDLEGCPKGLFELIRAVEEEGDRTLPLHMSIGENLKRAISKEEKAKLYRHFRALAKL